MSLNALERPARTQAPKSARHARAGPASHLAPTPGVTPMARHLSAQGTLASPVADSCIPVRTPQNAVLSSPDARSDMAHVHHFATVLSSPNCAGPIALVALRQPLLESTIESAACLAAAHSSIRCNPDRDVRRHRRPGCAAVSCSESITPAPEHPKSA